MTLRRFASILTRASAVARGAPIMGLAAWLAACSSSDDSIVLPLEEAQVARELTLDGEPRVNRLTREQYAVRSENLAREMTDDEVAEQHDAYGRLGFFPRSFDLRDAGRASTQWVGAFYSIETKEITVIDSARHSTLIHELVHAMQDRHFDLRRLQETATSSDQTMAQRALIEGDAVVATDRATLWARGDEPTVMIPAFRTVEQARETSESLLGQSQQQPLSYMAHPAFAYSFGAAYVARRTVSGSGWSYATVNALLAGQGPLSTQEVLRAGEGVDPILETGLATLPAAVSAQYAVEEVDRIGEWLTYLLLYRTAPPSDLQLVTAKWDGDQLVVLRKKDGATPPSKTSPSGLMWTSIWDDEDGAKRIEKLLVSLHAGAAAPLPAEHAVTARDGEAMWIERRGNQVCFVKNLPEETMETLARVALSTKEERRMQILRTVASTPGIVD